MAWVLSKEGHPRLRAAVGSVYRRWMSMDEAAALAWMEERTDSILSQLFDFATIILITDKARFDPVIEVAHIDIEGKQLQRHVRTEISCRPCNMR